MNTRSLRCRCPKSEALRDAHSASYPLSAKAQRTSRIHSPFPPLRSLATFSSKTHLGRRTRTIRTASQNKPLRLPRIPAPLPAHEISWHGNPPHTTSGRSMSAGGNRRTSPYCGTSGHKTRRLRLQNPLISTLHIVRKCPVRSRPSSIPPIPANRLPTVILDFTPCLQTIRYVRGRLAPSLTACPARFVSAETAPLPPRIDPATAWPSLDPSAALLAQTRRQL